MKTTLLIICLSSLALTGCSVNGAIAADSLTTAYSIGKGSGKEANPILPKSALGAAVTSAVFKTLILRSAKHRNNKLCRTVAKGIYSTSFGASVNNGLIASGNPKHSIPAGLASGVGAYMFFGDKAAANYCG